jgi:glycosyltransferase involved in cell wall biosynthesis
VKPLLLNTYDGQGGAGIATYRIHRALRSIGVDSKLLVQSSKGDDHTVTSPQGWDRVPARLRPYLDKLPNRFFRRTKPELFSVAWVPDRVLDRIGEIAPDLVHLFWVNNGFVRLETLGRIRQPSVWTLHDMWPFTGGCHYDDGCGRFSDRCGHCPSIYSTTERDVSRRVLERKLGAWKDWDVTVVATSEWLAEEARASMIFRDRDVRVIPNAIDIDTYKPIPKDVARSIYNLPRNKRIVMFSAFAATSHPRKGGHLLMHAIEQIASTHAAADIELVIVGASMPEHPKDFGIPVHYMGHFGDEISQVVLYSAADVLVAPSMQENLSNTVLEALACGTPVVAFRIGGMPDLIEHQTNGYLAQAFEPADLAAGILWVLDGDDRHAQLSARARAGVTATYTFEMIAQRYAALYRELLGERGAGQ